MNHRNLPVINLRRSYKPKNSSANIDGYRNSIFLPQTGRYKGLWKNNLREGLGTLTTINGLTYEGNWMNDRKHGYGLLKKQLNAKRVQHEPIYDGEWNNGKRSGEGVAYYENRSYEGQWKNNCRDGLGIMTFNDGSYYIGEWQRNTYHGIGAQYDASAGTLYRGYFLNGKRCGEGTLQFLKEQKIQKGFWRDGVCVTSIIQNNVDEKSSAPSGSIIPKIDLADPVGVLCESLENEIKLTAEPIKFKVKKQM